MERKTRKTRKSLKLCQPERFIWWQLIIKFGYSKNWNPVCGKTTGPCLPLPQFSHEGHSSLRLGLKFDLCIPPVGETRLNHPFGNGLYHVFMVVWGMVYGSVLPTGSTKAPALS